jgi:hypothetical protein
MKKILFITFNSNSPDSGGSQCSVRNFEMLSKRYKLDRYIIQNKNVFFKILAALCGYFPPFSFKDKKKLKQLLAVGSYDIVFIDSSLLGSFAEIVKKKYRVRIISFFHNVEADYIDAKIQKGIRKYFYGFLTRQNEQKTIVYSDLLIALNERDKNRLHFLYGRTIDYLLPITFDDTADTKLLQQRDSIVSHPVNCLFVGSLIRPNYEGIKWFIDNVMDKIDATLSIVGKNFEQKKEELERKNVKVIGSVDDLAKFYHEADLVVSPLLFGGGMKVKIAEALMYGCNIFATSEAFEGYDVNYDLIGGLCNTSEEFIQKINYFLSRSYKKYNPYSREVFLSKYCTQSVEMSFFKLLEEFLIKK